MASAGMVDVTLSTIIIFGQYTGFVDYVQKKQKVTLKSL